MRHMAWLLLFSAPFAFSQYGNMNGMDMEKMMQEAQKIQHCLATVDQRALEALTNEGAAMEKKIASLCKSGRRDDAVSEAMAFIEKMKQNPELEKLRQCGEQASAMIPTLPLEQYAVSQEQVSAHLCNAF